MPGPGIRQRAVQVEQNRAGGRQTQATLPNRPPCAAKIAQMRVGIAVKLVDHRDALEVMPDGIFVGHADAAMQLDRLLPDMAAGAADLHLGGGDRLAALDRVFLGCHDGGEHRHAAGLLHRHQHIDGAVLQHLERADRAAELLAGLQVFQRQVLHRLHRADRLGAQRGDGFVDDVLDQRQGVVADQVVGADADVGQGQFRGALAVLGRDSRAA